MAKVTIDNSPNEIIIWTTSKITMIKKMMKRKCIESRILRMRMSSISRIRGELSSSDRFKAGHRDLISSRGRNQLLVMKCRQLRINWLIWI